MQLTRQSLVVKHLASKDRCRQTLCGVLVEPDGTTIATDGRAMAIVTPSAHALEHEEAPAGFNPGEQPTEAMILPLDGIKAVKLPKSHSFPVLEAAHLSRENGHVLLAVAASAKDMQPIVHTLTPIDGHFPNCQQVMPPDRTKDDGSHTIRIGVAADLLAAVAKAAQEFHGDKAAVIELQITTDKGPNGEGYERVSLRPIRFHAVRDVDGQTLTGCIMPIKL